MAEINIINNRTQESIDVVGIVRDVARQWQTILLIAMATMFLAISFGQMRYHPTYTARTTLFVTRSGNTNIYQDMYSSTQVAPKFTEILNSNILKNKVAEDVGQRTFVGTASATNESNTNFVTLTVTTDSPEMSFRELKSILNNYSSVSKFVMDGVIFKELEPASVPSLPDQSLNNIRNGMTGFSIGALLMVGLLALLSFLRDTIRNESDIEEKLDTSILVSIPHEIKYHTLSEKIKREKKSILLNDPAVSFRYVEALDRLARRVKTKMDDANAKTLLVCSVMENEGKSSVAANLALAMARQGERVVLLDGDLRKPSQYKIFGLKEDEFISFGDVLTGKESIKGILRKIPHSKLYCVFNRNIIENSSEVITSPNLRKIMSVIRSHADYIIMDTSPMALVSDTEELVSVVDSVVLVVRQNTVEAEPINDAIDVINARSEKLLGCVFNDVYPDTIGGFNSYGYNYNRYGYGGKYEPGSYGKKE